MRRRILLGLPLAASLLEAQHDEPIDRPAPDDVKLPNGKSQREAILKDEFKHNLKDVDKLASLANELKEAMEASDAHVVSLKMIKQTEEIEKLAKTIRGRLKKF